MDPTTVALDWQSMIAQSGPTVAVLLWVVWQQWQERKKSEKRWEEMTEKLSTVIDNNTAQFARCTEAMRECHAERNNSGAIRSIHTGA